jgi:hypothetical protein
MKPGISTEYDQAIHRLTGGIEITWSLTEEERRLYHAECDRELDAIIKRRLFVQLRREMD